MVEAYKVAIGGKWLEAAAGERFDSVDPFSGQVWATLPRCRRADIDAAVAAADTAFRSGPWRQISASDRGRLLLKLGQLVARDADRLAEIEVRDNGKLITEMRAQLRYSARWWEYFGGLAD